MADDWRGQPDMHPWHTIAEELLARGWSVEDLALRMLIPDYDEYIAELGRNLMVLELYRTVGPTDARCSIGDRSGKAIARAFGISEDMIVNLDRDWRFAALATANDIAPHPAAEV